MDVYKAKIKSHGILDKLNLIIGVRRYLHNTEVIVYTWSQTALMRNLNYLLSDTYNNKAILHQLYFIWEFLQANVKHIVL